MLKRSLENCSCEATSALRESQLSCGCNPPNATKGERFMKTQWERYKELELIPDSAPAPKASKFKIVLPLVVGWRSLLNALAREQVYEQRTEYLERCWALNYSEPYTAEPAKSLQKLWMLMD
jgi:hypothetical protein